MSTIHLVLDTSALLAYTRGSEHVGEPLSQVAENDAGFTAPLAALAAAAVHGNTTMLELLTKHPAFEPAELAWTRWAPLAVAMGLVGRLDAAEALLTAHVGSLALAW